MVSCDEACAPQLTGSPVTGRSRPGDDRAGSGLSSPSRCQIAGASARGLGLLRLRLSDTRLGHESAKFTVEDKQREVDLQAHSPR
eukprot:347985-Hanusia_phi.AAC.3